MPDKTDDLKDERPTMLKKNHDPDLNKWNLVKAHIKSKDLDLAIKVLTELTDYPNRYNQKAIKMLQQINK